MIVLSCKIAFLKFTIFLLKYHPDCPFEHISHYNYTIIFLEKNMRNADLLIYVYFLLPNYAVMHMTSAISAHPAQFSDTFHRLSQTKQISHQTNAIFLVLSQTKQISQQTNAIFLVLSQTKQISHQTNAIFLVLSQTKQISHQTNAIFFCFITD